MCIFMYLTEVRLEVNLSVPKENSKFFKNHLTGPSILCILYLSLSNSKQRIQYGNKYDISLQDYSDFNLKFFKGEFKNQRYGQAFWDYFEISKSLFMLNDLKIQELYEYELTKDTMKKMAEIFNFV